MLSCPWKFERLNALETKSSVFGLMRFDHLNFESQLHNHSDVLIPRSLHTAILSRKVEFFSGRLLVKHAMNCLTGCGLHVPVGAHREPIWPRGFTGSISHSRCFVAAHVSTEAQALVGIDIEHLFTQHQVEEIGPEIVSQQEARLFEKLSIEPRYYCTLVFSAKEALFKAIFPQVKRYLNFNESIVKGFDPSSGVLEISLKASSNADGTYYISTLNFNTFILTSVRGVQAPLQNALANCSCDVELIGEKATQTFDGLLKGRTL